MNTAEPEPGTHDAFYASIVGEDTPMPRNETRDGHGGLLIISFTIVLSAMLAWALTH